MVIKQFAESRTGNSMMTSRYLAQLIVLIFAYGTSVPSRGAVTDVTTSVAIGKSGFVLNRQTSTYDTTVSITNKSSQPISAPLQLVIADLPVGVTLANASGTTNGVPYLNLSAPGNTLASGSSLAPFALKFNNPGRVTIAATLRLFGDVQPITGGLPPDPGTAGQATLVGIDSNGNGVRDDIERYIALTYPDSARVRSALTSFAVGMQGALLSGGNAQSAASFADKLRKAIDCLWYLQGAASISTWQQLRAQYLDTAERSRAYIAYGRLMNATVVTLTPVDQRKAQCETNPDTLPN